MIDLDVVNLSRFQFAATALYHFLFVPSRLACLSSSPSWRAYVMTGRAIWKR